MTHFYSKLYRKASADTRKGMKPNDPSFYNNSSVFYRWLIHPVRNLLYYKELVRNDVRRAEVVIQNRLLDELARIDWGQAGGPLIVLGIFVRRETLNISLTN